MCINICFEHELAEAINDLQRCAAMDDDTLAPYGGMRMRLLTVAPHTASLSSADSPSQPPIVPIRSSLTTAGTINRTSHSSKDMQIYQESHDFYWRWKGRKAIRMEEKISLRGEYRRDSL